jgi:hypothetical protein
MFVVAVVGGMLGAATETKRRHDRYLRVAEYLRLAEYHEASTAFTFACGRNSYSKTNALGEDVRKWSPEKAEWHHRLAEKYRSAAQRPDLPVPLDPPPPADLAYIQ